MTAPALYEFLGRAYVMRWRRRARWSGTYHAARMLRKSGCGLLTAKLILLGRA